MSHRVCLGGLPTSHTTSPTLLALGEAGDPLATTSCPMQPCLCPPRLGRHKAGVKLDLLHSQHFFSSGNTDCSRKVMTKKHLLPKLSCQ